MTFVIPKEEKWVKQVMLADQDRINSFLREKVTDTAFNNFFIHTAQGGLILLTYEENINAEKTTD